MCATSRRTASSARFTCGWRLFAAGGALATALLVAAAHAGETLDAVKSRGELRCGVSEGIDGFSFKDATGRWRGLDADFCRAVAAAALGNPEKVEFVPLRASTRFPALQAKRIDLLLRNTAWTLGREALLKVMFVGVLFHDSQGFMVPQGSRAKAVSDLAGETVCVEKGTTNEQNLSDYFAARGASIKPLAIDSEAGTVQAFYAGRCAALTMDLSLLAISRLRGPAGVQGYVILPEHISREPLGPAVRRDDDDWFLLVRWVLHVLVATEQSGMTRDNVVARVKGSRDPAVRRISGADPRIGKALGARPDWAMQAVLAVGNYGEMYERNLGAGSALKLERGLNNLWTKGGIMYAPPLR
jgi:general L-amino acid transport system substrate-binding protein